ncbi:MAG: SDR family oxidoreductase [Pseudomonadota bacterium]
MSPSQTPPVVLVTGGIERLGRIAAEVFAGRGWDVVIHHRGEADRAAGTAAAVEALGRRAWAVAADLGDRVALGSLVARAVERAGRLDALVNNASVFGPGRLTETDDRRMDELLQVNLYAPLILTRDFARVTSSGLVVNFLDSRIESLDWTHFVYTLSKQALREATRLAALELAPGIRVNAIAPGPVLPPEDLGPDSLARRVGETPLARSGGALDVAAALGWLIDADFVTGQVVYVDGGQHLDPYKRGAGSR